VSPIFEFKDGGLNYNVFLVYTKDGWKWSFDRGQDKIWNSPPYKVPPKFIGDFMISDQVKLLIDNLNQKDYREGIKYIMNNLRFPKNFIDSLGGSQELCTENVCLEKDEGFLFVVRKGNIGTEFKYDSSSRKWVSKSGAGFSSLKNDIFVKGYFGDDNVFVEKVEEVNDLLKNTKDIYLGPMIIFSIDEKEGVNSYGVVKDETDGPFSTILSSALDRIDELLSSYGDVGYEANEEVAEFIDNLAREGILLEEEYNEITFESRKLKYVKSLLREKSLQN